MIFSLRFHTSRNFQKVSFIKSALPSVFDKRSFFAGGNFDTRPTLSALPLISLSCGHGGIGRRVRFRFLWSKGCAGSSPVVRTIATDFFIRCFFVRNRTLTCTTTASSCAVHAHASRHFCVSPSPIGVRCKASPVVRTRPE